MPSDLLCSSVSTNVKDEMETQPSLLSVPRPRDTFDLQKEPLKTPECVIVNDQVEAPVLSSIGQRQSDSPSEQPVESSNSWIRSIGQVSEFLANFKNLKIILKKLKNEDIPNPKVYLAEMTDCFSKICEESKTLLQSLTDAQDKLSLDENWKIEIIEPSKIEFIVPHDPGNRCEKITSYNQRKYLSNLGPFRPKLDSFPINESCPLDKQRRFNVAWYSSYPLLEYSIEKDAAFCFACSLFPDGPGRTYSNSEWICGGVRQWHKMKSRGKTKKGKLAEHFGSESHKAALSDYCHLIHKDGQIDVLLNKSIRQNLIKEEQEREFNRRVLLILTDVARTLGRQSMAFRGAGDAQNENGNFKQIVNLLSRHNPIVKKWLNETSSRSHKVTYLSGESQNEFIQLLGDKIRVEMVSEIQKAGMYSVIADTTPDLKHHDRLTLNVRYVLEKDNELKVVERLFKMDIVLSKKSGEELARKIFNTTTEYQLPKIAFQSYDYAANMSGEYNGTQQKLSEFIGRFIPYIPCQPHRINIFVENACSTSFIFREFFNGMESINVFFTASTKRYIILEKELEKIENSLRLKNLSKTRWTAAAESVRAIHISYEQILDTLFKIKTSKDIDNTKKTQSQAAALHKKMLEFDFICCLFFAKNIMYKFKHLTEQLEKIELNAIDALQLIKSTVESFKSINDLDKINALIESAISFAVTMGVNVEQDFAKHHRIRRRPQRLDNHPETTAEFDLKTFYRKEFRSVLDHFIEKTSENLENMLQFFGPFEEVFCIPASRKNCTIELAQKLIDSHPLIKEDVDDAEALYAELEILLDNCQDCCNFMGICQVALKLKNVLPKAYNIVVLILMSPISSASGERSFSKLKLIYNELRTNMGDERLDQLMLISSEKDLTDSINLDEIVNTWSSLKTRRVKLLDVPN